VPAIVAPVLVGNSYFPVTWGGASHQLVHMRFGQCLWEAADDGGARHLVTLVAKDGDMQESGLNDGFDHLFDPWKQRLMEQSLRVKVGFTGAREFDRVYGIEDYFK
jgi:hypothetical protein